MAFLAFLLWAYIALQRNIESLETWRLQSCDFSFFVCSFCMTRHCRQKYSCEFIYDLCFLNTTSFPTSNFFVASRTSLFIRWTCIKIYLICLANTLLLVTFIRLLSNVHFHCLPGNVCLCLGAVNKTCFPIYDLTIAHTTCLQNSITSHYIFVELPTD